MAVAFEALAPGATGPINLGRKSDRLAVTTAGAAPADFRLASLETGVAPDEVDTALPGASFDERFLFDRRLSSFEERFAVTGVRAIEAGPDVSDNVSSVPPAPTGTGGRVRNPAATPDAREAPRTSVRLPNRKLAMLTPARIDLPSGNRARDGQTTGELPLPEIDGRTAVYDISARAVYLPNGRKLEAHSGLGSHMDDPRSVALKSRGPTPPNVYRLVMREKLFHGVRAIRLLPADESRMYGRDGMLAHSYMLGSSGQSNGCVSFSDYPAFLNAFLKGEVNRMVVVDRLDGAPSPKSGSGWLAEAIGNLFKPADRAAARGEADGHGTALSYQ